MTTTQQQSVRLSTAVAVTWLVSAAGLMIVGLTGIADESQFSRGLEVVTEIGVFAGPAFSYYLIRKPS